MAIGGPEHNPRSPYSPDDTSPALPTRRTIFRESVRSSRLLRYSATAPLSGKTKRGIWHRRFACVVHGW